MALNGTAMLLKSIVGQETFDQIQALATDGTLLKIVHFAENSETIVKTLERLEQKLEQIAAGSSGPIPALVAGPGAEQCSSVGEPAVDGLGMSGSNGAN